MLHLEMRIWRVQRLWSYIFLPPASNAITIFPNALLFQAFAESRNRLLAAIG